MGQEHPERYCQDSRKSSKLFEKALRRFAGEPADLLEDGGFDPGRPAALFGVLSCQHKDRQSQPFIEATP